MTDDPLRWTLVDEYWERVADREYAVPLCEDCGETFFPPRPQCPYCLSTAMRLEPSDGAGTVHTYTVVHRSYDRAWGDRTPYVNALVALDDGPVVFGNLVDCDPAEVGVDMPVAVGFETFPASEVAVGVRAKGQGLQHAYADEGEVTLPVFRPA